MNPDACPDERQLSALLQGALPEEAAETVIEHLETCGPCDARVSRLERNQSSEFLVKLREPAPEDDLGSEAACRSAVEILERWEPSEPCAGDGVSEPFPQVPEQYEVLEKLGDGGMGSVYRARHRRLNREVALKVLPPDRMLRATAVARFEREMQAIGQLNHPHIVAAYDAGIAAGRHYLAMELIEGPTLGDLVELCGSLEPADACELIRQAALGLAQAHAQGIIHRDVKPSNLMLIQGEDGVCRVKVLDLGLALLGDREAGQSGLTSAGEMMGTLEYMAPEQGEDSRRVGPAADLYSLGATLYKLLSGDRPYGREQFDTPLKLMRALALENPPSIASKRRLPPALTALVDRLLDRDPSARAESAAEVAAALAPWAADADLPALWRKFQARNLTGSEAEKDSQTSETRALLGDPTDAQPAVPPAAPNAMPSWRTLLAIAAGGIALVWAAVLLFSTQDGIVRVEVLDPGIQVTLDGEDRLRVVDGQSEFEVAPGKHALTIRSGETSFRTRDFSLLRGQKTVLRVALLDGDRIQVLKENRLVDQWKLPNRAIGPEPPENKPPGVVPTPAPPEPELPTDQADRAFLGWFGGTTKSRQAMIEIGGERRPLEAADLASDAAFQIVGLHIDGRDPVRGPLSEEEFAQICAAKLPRLESLAFHYHEMNTRMLGQILDSHPDLKRLDGFGSQPDALPIIEQFRRLESYRISNLKRGTSRDWFEMLSRKPTLRRLRICLTGLGPDDLRLLARLPRLETLEFEKEMVGDAGLAEIGKIKSLKTLWFINQNDQFTVAGLRSLDGLTNLERLMFAEQRDLTRDDFVRLQSKLPMCEIRFVLDGRGQTLPASKPADD